MTTDLDIPPLGAVVFAQSKRAKSVSISIRHFRPVRVAYPEGTSFETAHAYLLENLGWAKKNAELIRRQEREHATTINDQPKVSKSRAREIIVGRVQELADRHGFEYNSVAVRSQKARWGSCSHLNNISLNVRLVSLKRELMDYVILHELLHTRIKNHSRDYWAELDRLVVGRARDIDKKLGKHRLG